MFTHSNVPVNSEPKKNSLHKPTKKKVPQKLPKQRGTFGRIAEDIVGVAIVCTVIQTSSAHSISFGEV